MTSLTFTLNNIDQAAQFVLKHAQTNILCFHGQMGVGKTTLIKAIIAQLTGDGAQANSPTFGLVNEYTNENGETLAYHFDLYRIEDEAEALDMGIEEYLYGDKTVFLEWPEKISGLLPNAVHFQIDIIDQNERKIGLI
jgi:tRNA threonylcarbamoyladenosine biosynthesis protein TsaE